MTLRWSLLGAALALTGCQQGAQPQGEASPAASATTQLDALRLTDHRGVTGKRSPESDDAHDRDVLVRRGAIAALARAADVESARAPLLAALADEDPEVVAWAAYGLGQRCAADETEVVPALVARATTLATTTLALSPSTPARLDPITALARAIGRCGAPTSEATLVAWLKGTRAEAAAASLGLGDLAARDRRLREDTLTALLQAAAGSAQAPPVSEALYPFTQLPRVPQTVQARLHEVAAARLEVAGGGQALAVRALAIAGADGLSELSQALTSSAIPASERSSAARQLARLGAEGQRAIAGALPALAKAATAAALTSEDLPVLLGALQALDAAGAAKATLGALSTLSPPSGEDPVTRRVSLVRCAAAALLAKHDVADARLLGCGVGPDGDAIATRARARVLGRAPIEGKRAVAWRELVASPDPVTREAALMLIDANEALDATAELATALRADPPGVVATAAGLLARHPNRASASAEEEGALKLSPEVTAALLEALERGDLVHDVELAAVLADAAGALQLKASAPKLQALCASPYPLARAHADAALRLIGGKDASCAASVTVSAPEPPLPGPRPIALSLDTDVGSLGLTLDPSLAPLAVARVVRLARAGYYDGKPVHRVVAGFLTQLGAPFADGVGGAEGAGPILSEPSPVPFTRLSVGMAQTTRDTGRSQLFITLSDYPSLDGQQTWIGSATGPWGSLVEGDVVRKVLVEP